MYQLGVEALAEQERQVAEVRSRGSTLLAAGAVVASLLAPPAFAGSHPNGVTEGLPVVLGFVGAAVLLVSTVLLLRPYELGFSVNATATYRELFARSVLDQPMVDLALAEAFDERREENAEVVERLVNLLELALFSLAVEATGLAVAAALAS